MIHLVQTITKISSIRYKWSRRQSQSSLQMHSTNRTERCLQPLQAMTTHSPMAARLQNVIRLSSLHRPRKGALFHQLHRDKTNVPNASAEVALNEYIEDVGSDREPEMLVRTRSGARGTRKATLPPSVRAKTKNMMYAAQLLPLLEEAIVF